VIDGLPDQCDAVGQRASGHLDELEPQVAIRLFVKLLEDQRVLEADSPGGGGLNEALVADEEDRRLVRALRHDSIDLTGKQGRCGQAQVAAQGERAQR
jgi:hypothetical protein